VVLGRLSLGPARVYPLIFAKTHAAHRPGVLAQRAYLAVPGEDAEKTFEEIQQVKNPLDRIVLG
jgi:hypothetical protein